MVSNPNFYGQSTHGTPNQIEDGVDFPHTGIIKALSDGLGQNYAISGFDITIDSATQIDVGAGVIFRDGKRVAVSAVSNLTLSSTYTNGYHLLIASSASSPVLTIRNPTAADKVAQYTAGDTIIAVITHNGTANVGIQYLTVNKTENSLSLGYNNSGYTETGTLTADANGITMTGLHKLDTLTTATAHGTNSKVLIQDGANGEEIRTITAQSIADLAPQGDITGITAGAGLTGTDLTGPVPTLNVEVDDSTIEINSDALRVKDDGITYAKIQNVSQTNVVLGRDTAGAGVIEEIGATALGTMIGDTLQTITTRGATTAIGITNNGYRHYQIPLPAAGLTDLTVGAPPVFSHYYINANAALVVGTNGQVITIKNIDTNPILITHATAFEGGIAFAKDQRHTAPDTITLESLETIRLQYLLDSAGVPTATWYITETDTGGTAGIANVVDDTSPQLGGNLDVNSNKITGTIVFDGDVNIEAGHTLRTTTLPVVDINSDPNPLVLDTHAGRYLLCSSNITLPATSTQGDQYFLLNDSGSSISILRNGNNINGAASDATLTAYKGATCIAIGSNNWIVLGV